MAARKRDETLDTRKEILQFLANHGQSAFRPKEIARRLNYTTRTAYVQCRDALTALEGERVISRLKGGLYTYRRKPQQAEGVLSVNPRGFGYVRFGNTGEEAYVDQSDMGTALDGDRVLIGLAAPAHGDRRRDAEILGVVRRGRTQTVGTLKVFGKHGTVRPDDRRVTHDIYVAGEHLGVARHGQKVVVSIDRFENPHGAPEGRVLSVVGDSDSASVRTLSLAMSLGVSGVFPPAVLAEADSVYKKDAASDAMHRLDLRHLPILTIDPADARDFDDAIHLQEGRDGLIELGVHIADVSHYVIDGSRLDLEAFERGTSVYLPDHVVPMLPETLSNEVCSLVPGEDKLTFSCIMQVTPDGNVIDYEIRESIIRSAWRLTYEEAFDIIEGKDDTHPAQAMLKRAGDLAKHLTTSRLASGSIDFDRPEIAITLDENGNVDAIRHKRRTASTRLIEEFMLLANRTVAHHFSKKHPNWPFVFRVHDRPDRERIEQLAAYVRAFGYRLDVRAGRVDSKSLNRLFRDASDTPLEPVIEQAALRAMAKARYSTHNIGHYGLAFDHYTHFTSPIRRYPDLMVHRLLKASVRPGPIPSKEDLNARCEHCTDREIVAMMAEREAVKLKQVEYASRHVGDHFDGVVCGVTRFGVFVELNALLVEGMVHVRDMEGDYFEFDEASYTLTGRHTARKYGLGDTVRVIVVSADTEKREIDLYFAP